MFSLINKRRFSTIVTKGTKDINKLPSCLNCEHYNLVDSKCYAIKNIPILASDSRKNDCYCSCGPVGKQYKYIGPSFAQDNERIKENMYLSVTSLIFCKLFVFGFCPPYSMVICVLPLSLTAFYSLLFLEQTYLYKKMEKDEIQRLK
jgi:hypothetical protein